MLPNPQGSADLVTVTEEKSLMENFNFFVQCYSSEEYKRRWISLFVVEMFVFVAGNVVEGFYSSWRRSLSYGNQSTDLFCQSMDWFLLIGTSFTKELINLWSTLIPIMKNLVSWFVLRFLTSVKSVTVTTDILIKKKPLSWRTMIINWLVPIRQY